MVWIAALRESEYPDDSGVKLRGIKTIFFNHYLPVAFATDLTDSIDSAILNLAEMPPFRGEGATVRDCSLENPFLAMIAAPPIPGLRLGTSRNAV